MVDFELILAGFYVAFWVTIRDLLDCSIEVSILFPLYPVPLALVITTEVVLVFTSAWFSSYKPKTKWTNSLARALVLRRINARAFVVCPQRTLYILHVS